MWWVAMVEKWVAVRWVACCGGEEVVGSCGGEEVGSCGAEELG